MVYKKTHMSSTVKRLINNFFANLLSQTAILLLSTLFIIYLTRLLGPSEYGKYTLAINLCVIFFSVTDFFKDIAVRDIAKDIKQAGLYFSNSFSLNGCASIVIFIVICAYVNLFSYNADVKTAVYVLSIYYFLQKLTIPFDSTAIAFEKLWFSAVSGALEKAVTVFISLYLILRGGGLIQFVWAFVAGGFIRLVMMALFCERYVLPEFRVDMSVWKHILKAGYPLLVGTIFVSLTSRIGIMFLSTLKGYEAVGLFGAVYSLYNVVSIVSTSLTSSIFPLLSRHSQAQPHKFSVLFRLSFAILFSSGLLITLGAWNWSERIVVILFGEKYIKSAMALRIMFLSLPLFFVRNLLAVVLLAIDKQKKIMGIVGLGFIVNVILNMIFIPGMSYAGTALSFVGSEAVIFSLLVFMAYKHTRQ